MMQQGARLAPSALIVAIVLLPTTARAAAPVLHFNDITSGPRTGNGDTSGGQVAGQNGAIVTVWGVNLGSTQGTSKVYCNGVEAGHYYTWANATAPSNLSKFHQMQSVSFAVSGQATEDNGTIYALVNGQKSNTLKFTVRAGKIYFVTTKGNDSSGTGSWSKPWRTIPGGVRNLIVKAGMGPEWPDDASYHTGIRINAGHEDRRTAQIYCYQNTLYGCGWAGAADPASSGHLLVSPEAISTGTRVDFRNNIVHSTGEPYMASESVSLPNGAYRNAWFGDGGAPSWDTSAINADPRFVSAAGGDFRLQIGSPCRDVGTKLAPAVRDLLGLTRPQGSSVDLGVYEAAPASLLRMGSDR